MCIKKNLPNTAYKAPNFSYSRQNDVYRKFKWIEEESMEANLTYKIRRVLSNIYITVLTYWYLRIVWGIFDFNKLKAYNFSAIYKK